MRRLVFAVLLASCSVEKLPPIEMVHHGVAMKPKRVVVLPTDCVAAQNHRSTSEATAWCSGVDVLVASELAFRGIEVVDLTKLPVRTRKREEVDLETSNGKRIAQHKQVTVVGASYSDADMWTQRAALSELGIDALVRVRTAQVSVWPVRAIALVRVVRAQDAALIDATVCELEVSRLDSEAEIFDRAVRCALKGLTL